MTQVPGQVGILTLYEVGAILLFDFLFIYLFFFFFGGGVVCDAVLVVVVLFVVVVVVICIIVNGGFVCVLSFSLLFLTRLKMQDSN